MKIRVSTLVNIMLSVVLVVSIAANLTGAVDYDPWLDVTDDGYGGIDDIVSTAEHFGASGDPIKQCNITNWPKGTAVTVWYSHDLVNGANAISELYNADGFQRMHLLMYAPGLGTGESVTIHLRGNIYNYDGYSPVYIPAYSQILTSSNNYLDLVLYVPTEIFYFYADAATGTTCDVYLSFYLTR